MEEKTISRRQFIKYGLVGGAFIAAYPFMIERYLFQVNHYRIAFKNLPAAFHGFRIAHLTDLHYGFLMPAYIIEQIIQRTNRLGADAIVCTGDYIHEKDSTDQINTVWPILSQLFAPHGVYSVLGNHDHWGDTNRSLYWLERSGQNIRHRTHAIRVNGENLWITGAGDLWEDSLGIDETNAKLPEDAFKIVLAHNPDTADQTFNTRFDLMLCGHTHGGQVRFPFIGAPVVPVNNKSYTSGTFDTRSGKMFISKGLGWTIYPIRLNCPPEIAVIELVQRV